MRIVFAVTAVAALAACVEEPVDGRRAFIEDCAGCHGADARGSGTFGRHLIKEPPDLTRIAARNSGVFDRDAVMSTIDGLNRGAHTSGAMPEFGAGDLGPTVTVEEDGLAVPVPIRLLALTDYLQSIQR